MINLKGNILEIFIKSFLFVWVAIWLTGLTIGIRMTIFMAAFFSVNPIIFIIFLFTFFFLSLIVILPLYFLFRFLAEKIVKTNIWTRAIMYGFMAIITNLFFKNINNSDDIEIKNPVVISVITFTFFIFLDYLYKKIVDYYEKRKLKLKIKND